MDAAFHEQTVLKMLLVRLMECRYSFAGKLVELIFVE